MAYVESSNPQAFHKALDGRTFNEIETASSGLTSASFTTLEHFLVWAAASSAGATVYAPSESVEGGRRVDYKTLLDVSRIRARILQQLEPSSQRIVLLHFDEHARNMEWMWAVILAGYLPAFSTPLSSDRQQRKHHLQHVYSLLNNPLVLTSKSLLGHFADVPELELQTVDDLDVKDSKSRPDPLAIPNYTEFNISKQRRQATDPAILMLTSGSSGNAKAVVLTAYQLASSVLGKRENWQTTSKSVFLNWIGFDHVACLSEIHLHALLCQAEQVNVQAQDLIVDPLIFIKLLSKHKVSHTFAPNFFLALLDKRLSEATPDELSDIDLSNFESLHSGGEANVVQTAVNLKSRLESLGAKGPIIRMGYGLTESSGALVYGWFDPVYEANEKHEFASIGRPITGAHVRVMNADGEQAAVREVGSFELSGPVVFRSYFSNDKATAEAFTADGWFATGDRAYIDETGRINLAGRSKELLNINGAKYSPTELERAIERANFPRLLPSYTAVFSHRPPGSQTEGYVIMYGLKEASSKGSDGQDTNIMISKLLSAIIGLRPIYIVPLDPASFDKSTLGKLSRAKLRASFERGDFDAQKISPVEALLASVAQNRIVPTTPTEAAVAEILGEMLDLPEEAISTTSHIFEMGLTSISLFSFERALRNKLNLGKEVSIITLLGNPVISAIAEAIDTAQSREYKPVVRLQTHGEKTPLWLVHPGSGSIVGFLPLSRVINDRKLYALTARGLSSKETLFSSMDEICDVYYRAMKETQPEGPYAIAGYSFGGIVAFELVKRLEANGDRVAFCATLESPPYTNTIVDDIDWTATAVLMSYFMELIVQADVPVLRERFAGLGREELIDKLLEVARPAQKKMYNVDAEQLTSMVNVAANFVTIAQKYHPEGMVNKMDIFFCTPLYNVGVDRKEWVSQHLSRWQEFSQSPIALHECDGDHAELLNPAYVEGFKQRLNAVLAARGL